MRLCDCLREVEGWIELGLPEEALALIASFTTEQQAKRETLELKLLAQMGANAWNDGSDTARILCLRDPEEPEFFLSAAFCLHETGDTEAAFRWLLRGPRELFGMAVFHYNLACYLWTLGQGERARSHLRQAVEMDARLAAAAGRDRDLAGLQWK